ncbi:MAG: hypothetical protein ACI4E0_08580, partial [Blautia sp.]
YYNFFPGQRQAEIAKQPYSRVLSATLSSCGQIPFTLSKMAVRKTTRPAIEKKERSGCSAMETAL